MLHYKDSQGGRDEIKNLFLIDQADVEIIKLNFKGMFIDISFKQVMLYGLIFVKVGGLCTLDFMNCMAKLVKQDRLLKKSILLLKAWFTYEASFLGSYAACMATYALYVLVLFIFNNYADELKTPLDVFRKFFELWSLFDWDSNIITFYSSIKTANYYERLKLEVSNTHFVNKSNHSVILRWIDWLCSRE